MDTPSAGWIIIIAWICQVLSACECQMCFPCAQPTNPFIPPFCGSRVTSMTHFFFQTVFDPFPQTPLSFSPSEQLLL